MLLQPRGDWERGLSMTTPSKCYCRSTATKSILADIQRASVPDSALRADCCWSEICRVYAQHRDEIDREMWVELCRHRGTLGGFSKKPPVLPDFEVK